MNGGTGLIVLLCVAGIGFVLAWAVYQAQRINDTERDWYESQAALRNELARIYDRENER